MLIAVDTVEHYTMMVSSYPQTNFARNVISQDINSRLNRISEIFYNKGKLYMYVHPVKPVMKDGQSLDNTIFRNETAKYETRPAEPAAGDYVSGQ
jgi:hypothetical protein